MGKAVLPTAIEAVLGVEQLDGVADVLGMCDEPEAVKYLLGLLATKLVQDGEHAKAVTMYTHAGRWTQSRWRSRASRLKGSALHLAASVRRSP